MNFSKEGTLLRLYRYGAKIIAHQKHARSMLNVLERPGNTHERHFKGLNMLFGPN
ncbi:unnamed protein product [Nesidiocoris tenuis]|uniref:Uncharacterized protein n=1 Tax=Nesidiocoris tenuis TaxID=355587 RepID=A0A6H5HLV3_9HEMI|nr:unnamed protein product [Nesidiocoris tenuis]